MDIVRPSVTARYLEAYPEAEEKVCEMMDAQRAGDIPRFSKLLKELTDDMSDKGYLSVLRIREL